MKKMKLLIICCLVALMGYPRLLDPQAKNKNALLQSIADALDKVNIDVIQDWDSEVMPGNKPVIALLNGYTKNLIKTSDMLKSNWEKDFGNSVYGICLGIRKPGKGIDSKNITIEWKKAPPEDRVFISYAAENKEEADLIKRELENQGFVVFTYLGSGIELADDIAYFMCSAGNSFVIDTETARKKGGVIAEALAYQSYNVFNRNLEIKKKLFEMIKRNSPSYEEFTRQVKKIMLEQGVSIKNNRDIITYMSKTCGVSGKEQFMAKRDMILKEACFYEADELIDKYVQSMQTKGENADLLTLASEIQKQTECVCRICKLF